MGAARKTPNVGSGSHGDLRWKSLRGLYHSYVLPLHSIAEPIAIYNDDSRGDAIGDDSSSNSSSKSYLSLEDKQSMYKHVMCANIEQLWTSGRESLRYFYEDSSQVGLNNVGHPTHDLGIKSSFGMPLVVDQVSSDRTIVRVTTVITLVMSTRTFFH